MSRQGSKSTYFVARASQVQSHSATIYKLQLRRERLQKVIKSHFTYIVSLENQIGYLQDKIKNISRPNRQEEVKSWIQAKNAKIEEVTNSITQIMSKIEEIENKILYYMKN